MYPNELFFGITLYDILIFIGIITALAIARAVMFKLKYPVNVIRFILIITIISIFLGFLGAILFQSIYDFIKTGVYHLFTGLTFLGGLITGIISFIFLFQLLASDLEKKYLKSFINIAPIAITVAHGFGRIGCFTAGCCFGRPTDFIFKVKFPIVSMAYYLYGDSYVHPTQLYEAFFLFLLSIIFIVLLFKFSFKYIFPTYLISYGVFRFFLEFIRGDERGFTVGNLYPSQLLSILIISLGIILIILEAFQINIFKKRKKETLN